ncbi:hypothetical protein K0M31_018147 [Melipona bicolor]|uniref:Uncharacterized protein n=1 Tax=Melipona bicolor TaxID=60889 RepID=A0AA40FD17_9HYME|nr:hypothetical protein K0M31_018147 [Melipona bicolor]
MHVPEICQYQRLNILTPAFTKNRQFSRLSIFLQAPSPIVGANVSTIVPADVEEESRREGKKKKRSRKEAAARGSCRDGQEVADKETLERRVILPLMCVTRSTRPRTHHRRDNGVGVAHGGEMLDGSEPG